MTARTSITAAAMREMIAAAKAGIRVVRKPDGTMIFDNPNHAPDEETDPHDTQPIDLVSWGRPRR
jgi:hypothetical protein